MADQHKLIRIAAILRGMGLCPFHGGSTVLDECWIAHVRDQPIVGDYGNKSSGGQSTTDKSITRLMWPPN